MEQTDLKSLLDSELDVRLMIRRIADDSVNAILNLWDEERGCYWRDTEHHETPGVENQKFFPTVTYRSTEALLDLFFRHPDWLPDKREVTMERLPRLFSSSLADTPSALDSPGTSVRNPFTTSLYLITACRANRLAKSDIVQASNMATATQELFAACLDPESPYSRRHPVTEFHILRAIRALWPKRAGPSPAQAKQLRVQILKNVRELTEKLLAKHMLKQLAPSDCVALVFCAATLALEGGSNHQNYILPALTVGFEAQDSSGCWPLGRIVRQNRGEQGQRGWDFTISTYEIAWAASETLLKLLRQRRRAPGRETLSIFDRLVTAGRYAERSAVQVRFDDSAKRGWVSDAPYGWLFFESWTSANVLQSIVSLSELLDERICGETLRTFVFLDPRSRDWPSWKRWEKLKRDAEPEDENGIFDHLDELLVQKIKNNPRRLPSAEDMTVSVLLFGPPGTSKTTVAHAIADGLGWPIVMLSPGDFIGHGLEFIEAEAQKVFNRLHKLHRVVVLFDECDELFRQRPEEPDEAMRNITAFVTASMLPKIEDLHDRGRVVFCICTNRFRTLDTAIKRGGRIDHILAVGPPQQKCRERIITEALKTIAGDKAVAIEGLSVGTDRSVRREILRACEMVKSEVKDDWENKAKVKSAVANAVERTRESLMISPTEYEHFKDDQRQFSHPSLEKR